MKCALILGFMRGLRGSKEQVDLKTYNFKIFRFSKKYGKKLAGKRGVRLYEIPNDKTHDLGFDNCQVRDESDSIPFPELSDGKSGNIAQDLGGPIIRMLEKLKKGEAKDRFYRRILKDGSGFCNAPLGREKLKDGVIREGMKRMGISNWDTIRPHAMRAECINVVANSDKQLGDKQRMRATRHKNMQSHQTYQKVGAKNMVKQMEAMIGDIEDEDEDSRSTSKCRVLKQDGQMCTSTFGTPKAETKQDGQMCTSPFGTPKAETKDIAPPSENSFNKIQRRKPRLFGNDLALDISPFGDNDSYKTDSCKMPATNEADNICTGNLFSQESPSAVKSDSNEKNGAQASFPFTQIAMNDLDIEMQGLQEDMNMIDRESMIEEIEPIGENQPLPFSEHRFGLSSSRSHQPSISTPISSVSNLTEASSATYNNQASFQGLATQPYRRPIENQRTGCHIRQCGNERSMNSLRPNMSQSIRQRRYGYSPYAYDRNIPSRHFYASTLRRTNLSIAQPAQRHHPPSTRELQICEMRREIERMRVQVQRATRASHRSDYLPTHDELYRDALEHYHDNARSRRRW